MLAKIGKCRIESILLAILSVLFIVCEIFYSSTYLDEITCVLCIFHLAYLVFTNKLTLFDKRILILLFLSTCIGLISSINSKLVDSWFVIGVDVIANIKVFVIFLSFKYLFSLNHVKEDYLYVMANFAKVMIAIATIFCIINAFINIGMSASVRFGIRNYVFIFKMSHVFNSVMYLMLGIIICDKRINEKTKIKYYLATCFCVCFTLKGPALIFSALSFILSYYFLKKKKIDLKTIVLLFFIVFLLGYYQITEYLLDSTSPRFKFYFYGFLTAIKYFPFGSGFATFGSDMASRNYSKLYLEYGFDKMWGMNQKDGWFLSDNGYAMYVAQNGFVGAVLFLSIFVIIFIAINKRKDDNLTKAFLVSLFISVAVHAVGSAILTSSQGVIEFIALALGLGSMTKKNERIQ